MSEKTETTEVVLTRLRRDRAYQVRQRLDGGHIERLARAYKSGREVQPITVAVVDEEPILIDGWHRVEAMLSLGLETAPATVVNTNEREARWLAASANLNHGLPLKPRELRQVFRAYVRARKHLKVPRAVPSRHPGDTIKSYRDIAPDIGVSHATIRNWMMKDFPKIAAKMAGDEDFRGYGGLIECEPVAASGMTPRDALNALLEAFRQDRNEDTRGALIEMVEATAREMKQHGNWRASDF